LSPVVRYFKSFQDGGTPDLAGLYAHLGAT
jgi:hypothetical protein